MSLDDRISESLNLRSKNTNSDSVYANSFYNGTPSTSKQTNESTGEASYGEPVYDNCGAQYLLETTDYYTKLSTPETTNVNRYQKNIYVPSREEEKLREFSDAVANSKSYAALKYQNVDYGYGYSTGRGAYDVVASDNVYSEIGDAPYATYANACLYDEVYEEAPRPHRPAPPCPSRPK